MSTTQASLRRKRRSSVQLHTIMARFATSGLSRSAFCQKHSISSSTFYRWHKRMNLKSASAITTEKDTTVFVELADVDNTQKNPEPNSGELTGTWDIELQIDERMVLRLRRSC